MGLTNVKSFHLAPGCTNLLFRLTRGEAHDPVKYFAHPNIQKCLGIVKRQRKLNQKLIIAPFPEKQRGSNQFFFQSSLQSPLTTCFQA